MCVCVSRLQCRGIREALKCIFPNIAMKPLLLCLNSCETKEQEVLVTPNECTHSEYPGLAAGEHCTTVELGMHLARMYTELHTLTFTLHLI